MLDLVLEKIKISHLWLLFWKYNFVTIQPSKLTFEQLFVFLISEFSVVLIAVMASKDDYELYKADSAGSR